MSLHGRTRALGVLLCALATCAYPAPGAIAQRATSWNAVLELADETSLRVTLGPQGTATGPTRRLQGAFVDATPDSITLAVSDASIASVTGGPGRLVVELREGGAIASPLASRRGDEVIARLPAESIRTIERASHRGAVGALIGAGATFGTLTLFGALYESAGSDELLEAGLGMGLIFAPAGALIGRTTGEEWHTVYENGAFATAQDEYRGLD